MNMSRGLIGIAASVTLAACATVAPELEEERMGKSAVAPKLPEARPPRPLDPKRLEVVEHTLKNGLKVRLIEDHAVPTVTYYTFFRVGSRNERPGITGLAHFFEHMMFNGAKKYGPKEFDRVLESRGGYSNAYTSNDVTAYYEDFASDALATVVELESDRMRSLAVAPELFESERGVVMEERRLRVDNDTTGMLDEAMNALVYRAHPYRWPVIGWMGDIASYRREDALAFFRTFYAPNNATIVAVGDLDPKATIALIEAAYADIPAGPPITPVVDAEPEANGERRAVVHYPAQSPAVMIGYRGPKAADPDTFVLDVIQAVLSSGESSRLSKRLVYGEELSTGAMVDFGWRLDPAVFLLFAEVKAEVPVTKVEAALIDELAKVEQEGVQPIELQKAKNVLRAHFLAEIATNNGRAHAVGSYETLLGDWREAYKTLDRYAAVTNEDVKRVAAKYFSSKNRSVVTLVPTPEEPEATPAAPKKGEGKGRRRRAAPKEPAARAKAARKPARVAPKRRSRPAK